MASAVPLYRVTMLRPKLLITRQSLRNKGPCGFAISAGTNVEDHMRRDEMCKS